MENKDQEKKTDEVSEKSKKETIEEREKRIEKSKMPA